MSISRKRKKQVTSPVLLVGFRRPKETLRVFNKIKEAKPCKFYFYVDGPRNAEEKIQVDLVKEIASKVDWSCEFKTFFRTKNMGMVGLPEALKWFINNVGEGIALEDDVDPSLDAFRFCSELLEKYRDDTRIMCINGLNYQRGWSRDESSYYFSKYPTPKFFALWKRSLEVHDDTMKSYPHFVKNKYLSDIIKNKTERALVKKFLHDAHYLLPEAADARWMYSIFINNALAITPNKNLVRDTGFGKGAGHMKKIDSYFSLPIEKMSFPLKYPIVMIRDDVSDARYFRWLVKNKLKKHFLLKTRLYRLLESFAFYVQKGESVQSSKFKIEK